MEDVLIVFIVFGFATVVLSGIYKLVRTKIEGNSAYGEEAFNRLAKAFMQHKKDTERRIQNLEAIVTEEDISSQRTIEEPYRTIEIDEESNKKNIKSETNEGNLKNMLRE